MDQFPFIHSFSVSLPQILKPETVSSNNTCFLMTEEMHGVYKLYFKLGQFIKTWKSNCEMSDADSIAKKDIKSVGKTSPELELSLALPSHNLFFNLTKSLFICQIVSHIILSSVSSGDKLN
jgi:hypothetical protein